MQLEQGVKFAMYYRGADAFAAPLPSGIGTLTFRLHNYTHGSHLNVAYF
jgi:hypothetical protein